MSSTKLLLAGCNPVLQQVLREQLQLDGAFVVEPCETVAEAFSRLQTDYFDILILDGDAPDLAPFVQGAALPCPVLLLSTEGQTPTWADKLGSLKVLSKPIRLADLLDRLQTLLQQEGQNEEVSFAIGPHRVQPAKKQLLKEGKGIPLTDKEILLLRHLLRAGNIPVSREELLKAVWGYGAGLDTHTLETHIYRLRQKLEDDPAKARILVTEEGGYRVVV